MSSALFFETNVLRERKKLLRNISSIKRDYDQAKRFPGLVWVQTVCKNYQQTRQVINGRQSVKAFLSQDWKASTFA